MTYELLFAGVGGAILGALFSTWLAYRFQRVIHLEQLAAQQKSQEAFLASLKLLADVHTGTSDGLKLQISHEGQSLVKAIESLKRD